MTSILFEIVRIWRSLFKRYYLKYKRRFFRFLFLFLNIHQILIVLKKKMIVIANVLVILQTVKDLVTPLSKKYRFKTPFDSENVKGSQTLVKSA